MKDRGCVGAQMISEHATIMDAQMCPVLRSMKVCVIGSLGLRLKKDHMFGLASWLE